MLALLPNLQRVTLMCLASSFHHCVFLSSLAVNHVAHVASVFERNAAHWQTVNSSDVVMVSYPWLDTEHVFTGIPPHAALLQELTCIKMEQQIMRETFIEKVK